MLSEKNPQYSSVSTCSEKSQPELVESVGYTLASGNFTGTICPLIAEIRSRNSTIGTNLRNVSPGHKLLFHDLNELSKVCNKYLQNAHQHNTSTKEETVAPPAAVKEHFRHTLHRCLDIVDQIKESFQKYNPPTKQLIVWPAFLKGKEECEADFPRFRLEILMTTVSIYFGIAFLSNDQSIGQEMERSYAEESAPDILLLLRRMDANDLRDDTRMVCSPAGRDNTITHLVYKQFIHTITAHVEETQTTSVPWDTFTMKNSDGILKSLGIVKGTMFNYAVLSLLSRYVNLDSHSPSYDNITNDSAATLVAKYPPSASSSKSSLLSRSISYIKHVMPPPDFAIQSAMNSRNYTLAYKLLSNGGNPHISDNHGRTLLHIYAHRGDSEKVSYLLHNTDSKIDSRDHVGKTPLHHACQQHPKHANLSTFTILLDSGADVNARDNNGYTPLQLLSWKHNIGYIKTEVINLLLARAADIYSCDDQGRTPFHTACDESDTIALMALLQAKPNPNVSSEDYSGRTPLHYAAYRRCLSAVLALFNHGCYADPNTLDERGMTPLHLVFQDASSFDGEHAEQQTRDIVSALVDRGSDVNAMDIDGWTPLHHAVKNRSVIIVEDFLMVEGVDVNTITNRGVTPLVIAAEDRGRDMVELLLSKGAKVSEKAYRRSIHGRVLGFDEKITEMLEKGERFEVDEYMNRMVKMDLFEDED